ncbi:hypothetical protein Ndes2526B_g06368 [Nannochloris sp. 'desiccata']|nr:hypothetical protein KSW81_008133 [Chlorella desiccata (nom. nud.)]KAH7619395.1 hypothetical protein NADE_006237 [Chlorella desiccata (nom. nud.)]
MDQIDARVVALQVIEAHERKNSNPYDCLLLPRTASFLDVKSAYKRLLFLHPDKNPTLDAAHEAFKIVIAAYNAIYNEIKASSQTSVPDLTGGNNSAAPLGHKWRAYTSTQAAEQAIHVDIFRRDIPSQPPPAAPPRQQPPTAWGSFPLQHSKWGRPSADAHGLLKHLKTSTSRLKTVPLPQTLESDEQDIQHKAAPPSRQENDLSKPSSGEQPENNEHEDGMEIKCGSFYGDIRRSAAGNKQNEKQQQRKSALSSSRAPLPPLSQQQKLWKEGGASKWSDVFRYNPLVELLRDPEIAAPGAAKEDEKEEKLTTKKKRSAPESNNKALKKRQDRTRVVTDSGSDDDFNREENQDEKELHRAESGSADEDGGHGGAGSSDSSDGWDSNEEEEILPEAKKKDIVSDAAKEAKSKALMNLLIAQQRSQAKHQLQVGTAHKAGQRAAFGRRGGKRRKQTRLRLGPITSK